MPGRMTSRFMQTRENRGLVHHWETFEDPSASEGVSFPGGGVAEVNPSQ